MKEKQNKCSVKYISYYDHFLIGLHILPDCFLYIGSKIYIEKIFSKKYPNNIFDWLQGKKIEIYTKYLEKKSNLVSSKYLRLHRWISHVELSIFQVWTLIFQVEFVISQLGGDSVTWRWFATWFIAWRPFRSQGTFLQAISQPISQLRNEGVELRNGTHVPRGGVAIAKHLAKFSQLISLSFVRLSSNSHNFFVSAPIHVSFEALDFWLPKIRKNI